MADVFNAEIKFNPYRLEAIAASTVINIFIVYKVS